MKFQPKDILKNLPERKVHTVTVQVKTTCYVYKFTSEDVETGRIAKAIWSKMLQGHMAKFQDGRKMWVDDDLIFDPTQKAGSAQYTWKSEDNDKCLHDRFLVTMSPDGTKDRTFIKQVWKLEEN